jgi:hypothetical protein
MAAVGAISIVSRSRISRTRMTFGACRSAAFSAAAKVGVTLWSSRWWMLRAGLVDEVDQGW